MKPGLLYLILAAALLVIAGLAGAVVHYRHRLRRCQQAMVRCINENLDLRAKLPPGEQPHLFTSQEITSKELTKIICNMLKRLMYVSVFFLLAVCKATAQEQADTACVFRFVAGDDMFYVPFGGNGAELARLETCVEQLKGRILAGEIPVQVDGYCISKENEAENLAVARIRSNRVKSELITRQGLTEECFATRNHADGGEYVTVTIKAPSSLSPDEKAPSNLPTDEKAPSNLPLEGEAPDCGNGGGGEDVETPICEDEAGNASQNNTTQDPAIETQTSTPEATPSLPHAGRWEVALRFNLLRWATLTPDLGLEWRITPSVGIAVNGSWTSWSWNDAGRRYALWEVAPEVRWYLGETKRGYLGAMYKAGGFNYKLSATGRQGDLMGGGITGGYQLRLNKALSLDFNVAVGCLHADYEKYTVAGGVCVRSGKESGNWWGPINAGVSLVWVP